MHESKMNTSRSNIRTRVPIMESRSNIRGQTIHFAFVQFFELEYLNTSSSKLRTRFAREDGSEGKSLVDWRVWDRDGGQYMLHII